MRGSEPVWVLGDALECDTRAATRSNAAIDPSLINAFVLICRPLRVVSACGAIPALPVRSKAQCRDPSVCRCREPESGAHPKRREESFLTHTRAATGPGHERGFGLPCLRTQRARDDRPNSRQPLLRTKTLFEYPGHSSRPACGDRTSAPNQSCSRSKYRLMSSRIPRWSDPQADGGPRPWKTLRTERSTQRTARNRPESNRGKARCGGASARG